MLNSCLGNNIQILNPLFLILAILAFVPGSVYAQNSTSALVNEGHIDISKVSSSNTIISNGTSFVGSYGTTYTITGPANDIKNSKDLIRSSILDDFTNTSTIGYVKLSDSNSNSGNQQIANPFASNEQIEQKITEILNKVTQDSSSNDIVSITCNFGNFLDLFSCSSHLLSK